MPAEVENMVYDRNAMGSRGTPWHGFDNPFDGLMTAQEVASKVPELASDMATWPSYAVNPETGEGIIDPTSFKVVRLNDLKIVGHNVGMEFTPFFDMDAARLIDQVMGDVVGDTKKFETAGTLRDGALSWWLADLGSSQLLKSRDLEMQHYLFARNYHNGTGKLTFGQTNVQVVCKNTWDAAVNGLSNSVAISHTAQINDPKTVEAASKALGLVVENIGEVVKTAEHLLNKPFTESDFVDLTGMLFPIPPDSSKRIEANAEQRRAELLSILRGADYLQDVKNTAYGAYGAVTDYADFYMTKQSDSKQQREARFRSILDGGQAMKLKTRAFELIAA